MFLMSKAAQIDCLPSDSLTWKWNMDAWMIPAEIQVERLGSLFGRRSHQHRTLKNDPKSLWPFGRELPGGSFTNTNWRRGVQGHCELQNGLPALRIRRGAHFVVNMHEYEYTFPSTRKS